MIDNYDLQTLSFKYEISMIVKSMIVEVCSKRYIPVSVSFS